METVVSIIMILVCFSSLLKQTCLPLLGRVLTSLGAALFIGMTWRFAISQSKTEIAEWLVNPELMRDMAVVLTLDVFLQISFCLLEAGKEGGNRQTKIVSIVAELTRWLPGILIFPVLLAMLTEVIFSFSGMDFAMTAWSLAAAIFVVWSVGPSLVRLAMPEKDQRLELMFMVNVLIGMLGVVATVNGRTRVASVDNMDWHTLVAVMAVIGLIGLAGFIIYQRKQKKINKQQ